MNKDQLIIFLEKFGVSDEDIKKFVNNKEVIVNNKNVFLTTEKMKNSQVFAGGMIFIYLKKLLPTMYLLNFIKEKVECVEIKSQKQALNFTYGKNLSLSSFSNFIRFDENKYYIAVFNNKILGYFEFVKKDRLSIVNKMNVGDYLKEK